MRTLVVRLKQQYPQAQIQGHRDFPFVKKACPSFDARKEFSDL
jgi:N-acetylmuramoyl-L-alanine amidase